MTQLNKVLRVGAQCVVDMRYRMKNSTGEILVDTLQTGAVTFAYGSGEILPGLEDPLRGMMIGEQKSFSLSPQTTPGLDQTFYFDVVIDDIRPQENARDTISTNNESNHCGPGCCC